MSSDFGNFCREPELSVGVLQVKAGLTVVPQIKRTKLFRGGEHMQFRKTLLGLSAVALTAGFGFGQPVQANDALDYLNQYFGGVNNSLNYSEAERMTRADGERAKVDDRVSSALSTGRITPVQAADLEAQLRNNRTLQMQFAEDGRFSFSDNERIMAALNEIESRLQNSITTNIVINPRPGYGRWQAPRGFVARTDVDQLEARIATRIEQGRHNGRLTSGEAGQLRSELNNIRARKHQMATTEGYLSFAESQRLLNRLSRLQDQLRVELNDGQVAGREQLPWY